MGLLDGVAMPVLLPDSGKFAGFNPGTEFISAMQSGTLGTTGALATLMSRKEYVSSYLENFGNIALHTAANLAITPRVGVPDFRMEAFGKVFSEWPIVKASGSLGKTALATAVRGAALIWNDALQGALSDIPIFGWIVDIGTLVYRWIKAVLDSRKSDEPAPKEALVYDYAADSAIVRGMLGGVGDRNWTSYFMPPATDPKFTVDTIRWVGGDPQGRRISFDPTQSTGSGLLPGLADMIGDYQYPFKQGTSNRPAMPSISLETWGKIFPSGVQFGVNAWEMVMKISPQVFAVNPDKIVSGWTDWYQALNEFRREHTGQLWEMITEAYSWGDYKAKTSKYSGFDPKKMPGKYVQFGMPTNFLIEYIVEDLYKPRIRTALKTIMCAYVGPRAQAIRGSSSREELHREMRQLLLTHSAVHDVELDMIPDEDYRNDVFRAQLPATEDFTARPSGLQRVGGSLDGAPLLVSIPPDPLPPNPGPGIPGLGDDSGAAIAIAALGAAAVLAFALSR